MFPHIALLCIFYFGVADLEPKDAVEIPPTEAENSNMIGLVAMSLVGLQITMMLVLDSISLIQIYMSLKKRFV